MEQYEIERLVNDIQEYLNHADENGENESMEEGGELHYNEEEAAGIFIGTGSRTKMERFLKFFQFALYTVEVLTISLFTAVMMFPFRSWPQTIMFLIGVLLFGIFTISLLLGLQTRIRLLFSIESNTRQIADSKTRIAEALENIRLE